MRSTIGARGRGARRGSSRADPVSGNTELDGWRIMAFSQGRSVSLSFAPAHELIPRGRGRGITG
jgi:hypothetical protein